MVFIVVREIQLVKHDTKFAVHAQITNCPTPRGFSKHDHSRLWKMQLTVLNTLPYEKLLMLCPQEKLTLDILQKYFVILHTHAQFGNGLIGPSSPQIQPCLIIFNSNAMVVVSYFLHQK